jgi:hypothetical protein
MPNDRNESEGPPPTEVDDDPEDELEELIEQMDRPMGSDLTGTTAEEQLRGASLEERTRGTRSERREDAGVALSEDDAPDDEPQLIGEEGDPEETSPEERAMHVRPDAPGGVWEEGDDYVEK